jgi:hypothetical protein
LKPLRWSNFSAALDPLCQLDLLRGGQQVDLADVLQEELQRVGGDLTRLLDRPLRLLPSVNHLDLLLFERVVEVVDLRCVELELAQRERDLLHAQRPGLAACFQQPLGLVRLQHLGDGRRSSPFPLLAHCDPSWACDVPHAALRMRHSRTAAGRTP